MLGHSTKAAFGPGGIHAVLIGQSRVLVVLRGPRGQLSKPAHVVQRYSSVLRDIEFAIPT